MLVLSRRPEEKLVFPQAGITVHVLGVRGNTVRIGVDAPRDIKVLREELAGAPSAAAPKPPPSHALSNRLNKLGLLTHLLEKQWAAGRAGEAEETLKKLAKAVEALERESAPRPPAAPPARPKVRTLLVEDDANERELLAGLLNLNGYECDTAEDGLAALDFLASHERPDFVLMDMLMPRCDGPEAVARIRSDPRFAGLKIFAVSGSSPREFGLPTGPEGVDGWFPKPLNPRTFWDALQNCLGARSASN
jgi:carbon storage regulator CsrA